MTRRALLVLACACAAALAAAPGVRTTSAAFTATATIAQNSVAADRLGNYLRVTPGQNAGGTVDTLSIDLGLVRAGSWVADLFTVTNTTEAPVDATLGLVGPPQIETAAFTGSGTGRLTLAPGESSTVVVHLSSSVAGHGAGVLRLGLAGSRWLYRDYPIRLVARPLAPPTLAATARAGGRVELAWAPSETTTIAGYSVYRSSGGAYAYLGSTPPGQVGFDDTTAVDGTAYTYRVRAVAADDPDLTSLDGPAAGATADATPPPAPRAVSTTGGGAYVNAAGAAAVSVTVLLAQPAAAGDAVTVAVGGIERTGAPAPGAMQVTVSGIDVRGLADGPVTIRATATDGAGNVSPAATGGATKDTLAPGAPVAVFLDAKNKQPDRIAGTAEPGASVTAMQTAPVASGPYTTLAGATGAFELTVAASRKEAVTYVVTAADAAGNVGPATVLSVPDPKGKGEANVIADAAFQAEPQDGDVEAGEPTPETTG